MNAEQLLGTIYKILADAYGENENLFNKHWKCMECEKHGMPLLAKAILDEEYVYDLKASPCDVLGDIALFLQGFFGEDVPMSLLVLWNGLFVFVPGPEPIEGDPPCFDASRGWIYLLDPQKFALTKTCTSYGVCEGRPISGLSGMCAVYNKTDEVVLLELEETKIGYDEDGDRCWTYQFRFELNTRLCFLQDESMEYVASGQGGYDTFRYPKFPEEAGKPLAWVDIPSMEDVNDWVESP